MTSVKQPKVLGDIVTLPIAISDSATAVPSLDTKAAVEVPVFLGILTSPCNPLNNVAPADITEDEFLNASMKSPALKSCPTAPASSVVFKSL